MLTATRSPGATPERLQPAGGPTGPGLQRCVPDLEVIRRDGCSGRSPRQREPGADS
jgi:hypothetical protein